LNLFHFQSYKRSSVYLNDSLMKIRCLLAAQMHQMLHQQLRAFRLSCK